MTKLPLSRIRNSLRAILYSSVFRNLKNQNGEMAGFLKVDEESKLSFTSHGTEKERLYQISTPIPKLVEFLLGSLNRNELCDVIESCSKKLRKTNG